MSQQTAKPQVGIEREGAVGVITLDRPDAINALTLEMVDAVIEALEAWAETPAVKAVLIEGHGDRGLCAGGDVRAVRESVLSGQRDAVERFFAREYAMNRAIACYAKPIIAYQNGTVMGGGIGISSHARYRLATETSRFAMPEGAIGFFSDVGVNALLALTPKAPALAFLLSGEAVEAADAIALGLSDAMIGSERWPGVRQRLIEAAKAEDVDTAITAVIQAEGIEAGEARFVDLATSLADCFDGDTVASVLEMLDYASEDGEVGAAALASRMRKHSPTSLSVILASHLWARRVRHVETILDMDYRLAQMMAFQPDFAEGVRAVLVDKDKAPAWSPDTLSKVKGDAIAAILSP